MSPLCISVIYTYGIAFHKPVYLLCQHRTTQRSLGGGCSRDWTLAWLATPQSLVGAATETSATLAAAVYPSDTPFAREHGRWRPLQQRTLTRSTAWSTAWYRTGGMHCTLKAQSGSSSVQGWCRVRACDAAGEPHLYVCQPAPKKWWLRSQNCCSSHAACGAPLAGKCASGVQAQLLMGAYPMTPGQEHPADSAPTKRGSWPCAWHHHACSGTAVYMACSYDPAGPAMHTHRERLTARVSL